MEWSPGNRIQARLLLCLGLLGVCPLGVDGARAQSLDLTLGEYGLSFGNSKRTTGIRINVVDRDVERVRGLNLTLWTPGPNPEAEYSGLALALIGTKAREINGVALSGIGINASERVRGLGAGILGVATSDITGIALGAITVNVSDRLRGLSIGGLWTTPTTNADGIVISLGGAVAKELRGAAVGLLAMAEGELTGLALGIGGFYAAELHGIGLAGIGGGGQRLRGIFVGGVGLGAGDLDGIAASLGGIGGNTVDGLAVSGLGIGAGQRIRGVALTGLVNFAPEVTGITMGALNGFYIDRIDLEDFLHFDMTNRRFTGLSIGLFNYSAELEGIQLGLLNYAANNPRWARLLPLVNVHL
jgi:hypothetical protein